MKNDFEYALKHNELVAFFKGEGNYFKAREESWGQHIYMSNWQSMCLYLEDKNDAFQLLLKVFKVYLKSLVENNILDAWGLFNNIGCYYRIRYNNIFHFLNEQCDLINQLTEEEKKKITQLYRFLKENYKNVPGVENMTSLDRQITYYKERGLPDDLFSF